MWKNKDAKMIRAISFKAFTRPNLPTQHPENSPEKRPENGCQPIKPLGVDEFVKSTDKKEEVKEKTPQEALKDVLKNDLTNK